MLAQLMVIKLFAFGDLVSGVVSGEARNKSKKVNLYASYEESISIPSYVCDEL